ncbi:restriction endonuclease subunit S [Ligilactobacillus salivarius]|uniref:restriction endonuclease subunit S n=1 Tax=Ligilactobacillus salivarius TaxID=1624 RepID=UPI00187668C9|nr:restriction endonuclease subunit S [Ligilactobacillus salivarius]MBE5067069.1 restriction endonuclease subunit S [Ligilactobacillus salivarius]
MKDIAKIKNGKKTILEDVGVKVYGSNGVIGFSKDSNAPRNSIIIGRVGANTGSVFFSDEEHWVTDNAISVVPNNKINPIYLFYLLKQKKLNRLAEGSAQPLVNQKILNSFLIDIPSLEIQNKIADKLYKIDKKIEINNKINTNLLRQIKLISNSYFSYFEVFDGKIPTNWKYFKLTDIANLGTGYSYSSKDLQKNNNMAMATIKNFNRNFGFDSRGYKEIIPIKPIKKEKYANLFDILVAHTDLTQNADIIGNAEPVLNTGNYEQIIYSMDLVKVTPKDNKISPFLLSLILQGDMFKSHCMKYINGTTVLHLSKQALKDFELPLPKNISDLNELDEFATKAYKTLSNNIIENTVLEKIKSTLLNTLF